MRTHLTIFIACMSALPLAACGGASGGRARSMNESIQSKSFDEAQLGSLVEDLVATHGESARERVETGVRQASAKWRPEDGTFDEFAGFAKVHFLPTGPELDALFSRFQDDLEQILGHLHEIRRFLKRPTELDLGEILPVDRLFAAYNLGAHVVEDLFESKVGFTILLNFKEYTLSQKLTDGAKWSRRQWAEARAADIFSTRVPSQVRQKITAAFTAADNYISGYKIGRASCRKRV